MEDLLKKLDQKIYLIDIHFSRHRTLPQHQLEALGYDSQDEYAYHQRIVDPYYKRLYTQAENLIIKIKNANKPNN